MKIAILAPVHGVDSADRATAQINNYCLYLDPSTEAKFYLHISRSSSDEFKKELNEFQLEYPSRLWISQKSRQTSIRTALGGMIQLSLDLLNDNWKPDYVMWHSDSDLVIKKGIESEITRYNYGVGSSPLDYESSQWDHAIKMRADPRLQRLIRQYSLEENKALRIGRTECSFMELPLWTQVSECINSFFDGDYFEDPANHWCAEEVLLPTLAAYFATSDSRSRQQLCYTKATVPGPNRDPGVNSVSIEDIIRLREQKYFYAAKWFSPDLRDASRMYLANNVA